MEASSYVQALLVLLLVIGMIFGLSWILKRLGFGGTAKGPLGRRRRVYAVESTMLDGRHRAILLRRDNVEHLVLVGPNTSQVIESGIPAPADDDAPTALTSFSQLLSGEKKSP